MENTNLNKRPDTLDSFIISRVKNLEKKLTV